MKLAAGDRAALHHGRDAAAIVVSIGEAVALVRGLWRVRMNEIHGCPWRDAVEQRAPPLARRRCRDDPAPSDVRNLVRLPVRGPRRDYEHPAGDHAEPAVFAELLARV